MSCPNCPHCVELAESIRTMAALGQTLLTGTWGTGYQVSLAATNMQLMSMGLPDEAYMESEAWQQLWGCILNAHHTTEKDDRGVFILFNGTKVRPLP